MVNIFNQQPQQATSQPTESNPAESNHSLPDSGEVANGVYEIKARSTKPEAAGRVFQGTKKLGASIQEAIQLYGEATVYNMYIRHAIVACQNLARKGLEVKAPDSEISEALEAYDLGSCKAFTAPADPQKALKAISSLIQNGALDVTEVINSLKASLQQ